MMQCPVDNETLMMTERNGVEIDYCPKCRGVWLDRGELDKIIEKTQPSPASAPVRLSEPARPDPAPQAPQHDPYAGQRYDRHHDRRRDDDDYENEYRYKRKKKRESFLSELFDF